MEKKKVGRKPTGRYRDKNFSIKATEKELEKIIEILNKIDPKSKTDALLKALKIKIEPKKC